MAKAPENTRYMQHIAGRLAKHSLGPEEALSYQDMADALGITREAVYASLARPFRMWRVGELEKVASLLGWELSELISNALAYEPAISLKPGKAPKEGAKRRGPKPLQPASQTVPSI